MEAIVLAGGFGTRLAHIVSDCPKPMAPVAGKPFLEYILEFLIKQGVNRVIMAVGYKSEIISNHFGASYKGVEVVYSLEDRPLWTGGAIKKALSSCKEEYVYIINGDTYFDINLADMWDKKQQTAADVVIATKKMHNFERYGALETEGDKIIEFCEKEPTVEGVINGGIYLMNVHALDDIAEEKFSFEKEYLEADTSNKAIYAYRSNGYFIDIGIEEDYYKANEDFNEKSTIFR